MDLSQLSIVRPPATTSEWLLKDRLGALRVRFSIGRGRYRISPGLYRLGHPGKDSEVIVTANYKLSFDYVRRSLKGMDAWILVLETYGINVWCAAGKGTFGSEELIRRVKESQLELYISHRRLILPQLGATGISAKKVKEATGYTVKFGPVRSDDIQAFIASGYKKTPDQRTVNFNLRDRFILTGAELSNSLKYLFPAMLFVALLSGIHPGGYSFALVAEHGLMAAIYLLAAYLSGAFLAPVILPALPFRHFGGKGLVAGVLVFGLIVLIAPESVNMLSMLGWFLLSGAVASYLTMNFTGSSTYTSLSGVRKEMRIFVPLQIAFTLSGLALLLISKWT